MNIEEIKKEKIFPSSNNNFKLMSILELVKFYSDIELDYTKDHYILDVLSKELDELISINNQVNNIMIYKRQKSFFEMPILNEKESRDIINILIDELTRIITLGKE